MCIRDRVKVNNALREETGKDKKDIGREAFLGRAWKWKEEYGGRITKPVSYTHLDVYKRQHVWNRR